MTTLSKDARRQWLALYLAPHLGINTINQLIEHYSLDELSHMSAVQLAQLKLKPQTIAALTRPDFRRIEALEQWASIPGNHIICYPQPEYPTALKAIGAAPKLLFVKGEPALLSSPQIAMVGSREHSASGGQIAFDFAAKLANLDITVTSGLAIGIDGQSHKGALSVAGKTIAVLGSGLEQIYPKRHKALAEQIAATGALVSEFWPEQGPRAEHFPKRNRIISGLSLGTLVVEAFIKSGSLITARYAMEQGREVFAIPGSIYNPMSEGCHWLIKQGAKLVENTNDIIEELSALQHHLVKTHIDNCPERPNNYDDQAPLLACIGYEITSVDCIAERSQLPVHQVLAQLLDLEMAGKVVAVAGGYTRS